MVAPAWASCSAVAKSATLRFDGGYRPSLELAASSFVLYDEDGETLATSVQVIGKQTSNVAEYLGLIRGLKRAVGLGVTNLTVRGDSQLVIFQMAGIYKARAPHLAVLRAEAALIAAEIPRVSYEWNPREENDVADKLINQVFAPFHALKGDTHGESR